MIVVVLKLELLEADEFCNGFVVIVVFEFELFDMDEFIIEIFELVTLFASEVTFEIPRSLLLLKEELDEIPLTHKNSIDEYI